MQKRSFTKQNVCKRDICRPVHYHGMSRLTELDVSNRMTAAFHAWQRLRKA